MDDSDQENAVENEIALLRSMYPEEVAWDERALQLSFKHSSGNLLLRCTSTYPSSSCPDVISATGPRGYDVRSQVNHIIAQQQVGEPCLDAIITNFIELIDGLDDEKLEDNHPVAPQIESNTTHGKTIIIWLHHLLATGKRKLALAPGSHISGITKPGYPGVMLFSGPAIEVDEHVQELKQQRWQAFQVRYEEHETWSFRHGHGVIELESMGEVVADIDVKEKQKAMFMQVMKIK